MLVRLDYAASVIVNANHGVMRPAIEFGIVDCIAECVRPVVPQVTAWRSPDRRVQALFTTCIFTRPNESTKGKQRYGGSIPLTRSRLRGQRSDVVEAFVPNA